MNGSNSLATLDSNVQTDWSMLDLSCDAVDTDVEIVIVNRPTGRISMGRNASSARAWATMAA
jgi:hypothetical protein